MMRKRIKREREGEERLNKANICKEVINYRKRRASKDKEVRRCTEERDKMHDQKKEKARQR